MSEPVIVSPQNIPNPDKPAEVLTPVPPPDGKTSILVILALALGAYGIYRMVREDEALDEELEDDDDYEGEEAGVAEDDDYDDEDYDEDY